MNLQNISVGWAAGITDAFEKHGTLVKENAEATYAQMPAIVRDEVEKAQAQFCEIEWKDVPIHTKE